MWIRFWCMQTSPSSDGIPDYKYEWWENSYDNVNYLEDAAESFLEEQYPSYHYDDEPFRFKCGYEKLDSLPDDVRQKNVAQLEKTIMSYQKQLEIYKTK